MKLQKQRVYIPVSEHDYNNLFVVTFDIVLKNIVRQEDKYVFSEEELRAFADKIIEIQRDRDDWVRSRGQGWETEQPTVDKYIDNLLKQD